MTRRAVPVPVPSRRDAARCGAAAGPRRRVSGPGRQAGLTLVELLVAMTLGLLVVGAAVAALLVARSGFTSVDSGTQLRENARFASSLIDRIGAQAGFQNVSYGFFPPTGAAPPLFGCDNATVSINPTGPACNAAAGVNGSDALFVRYFGASQVIGGVLQADGSMINCAGIAEPQDPAGVQRATSVFHVATSASGEPTLACTYRNPTTGVWTTVPLVQGVESLQVLYGVDGVTPNAAPPAFVAGSTTNDSITDRYVTASQLFVAGNATATDDNWRKVRSVRIGMLLRGPVGSAVDRAATAQTYLVLGAGFTTDVDIGAKYIVATADGRLRQPLVFTIHLHNVQNPDVAASAP